MQDPIDRFLDLLRRAQAVDRSVLPDPTAFCLATVDAAGQPSARMLLLKAADRRGFVFYTNYESRKGRELLATHRAALCFHWVPLEVQVRVEGTVETVSDAEADEYFASRPRGSQLGAWASAQSRPIETDGDLEARLAALEARYADQPVPRPPHWSGFRLLPARMEFWRNRPSRLHERHLYTREEGGWRTATLYP